MWDSGNITTNILIIQKKNIYTSWDGKSFLFENIRKILQHPQLFCLRDEESSSVGFLIYNALSQMQCINSNFSVILEDFSMKNYWQCDYWKEVEDESRGASINLSKYLVSFLNSQLVSFQSTETDQCNQPHILTITANTAPLSPLTNSHQNNWYLLISSPGRYCQIIIWELHVPG